MARTKTSVGIKMAAIKNSKVACQVVVNEAMGSKTSARTRGGRGNPACPQNVPEWQKPITDFFIPESQLLEKNEPMPCCSKQLDQVANKPTVMTVTSSPVSDDGDITFMGETVTEHIDLTQNNNNDIFNGSKFKGKGQGKKTKRKIESEEDDGLEQKKMKF